MIKTNQHGRIRLLTGVPRSGTTLCCHLLNQFDRTIALHEPIEVSRLTGKSREEACLHIERFTAESLRSIQELGFADSKQKEGKVPDNPVALTKNDGEQLRKENVTLGQIKIDKGKQADPLLIIKHNALFTALLPDLQEKFKCYAIVRNPLSVLASWDTVEMPINTGRIPAGEIFDSELRKNLNLMDDAIDRQLYILAWFFKRFKNSLPPERVIKYEDVIKTQGKCLTKLADGTKNSEANLMSQNNNVLYDAVTLKKLYLRLINSEGEFWSYYSKEDIEQLFEASYR